MKIYILEKTRRKNLYFYDNFSSDFFFCRFHFLYPRKNNSINVCCPDFPSLPFDPRRKVDKILSFMASGRIAESRQSNYSFHTWTVIGDNWFFPDEMCYHNNSVIRFLRLCCNSCSPLIRPIVSEFAQTIIKNWKAFSTRKLYKHKVKWIKFYDAPQSRLLFEKFSIVLNVPLAAINSMCVLYALTRCTKEQ